MTIGFGLFAASIAAVMIATGYLIHKDLSSRGVDPVPVIVVMYCLWPVGLYMWFKRRNSHPRLQVGGSPNANSGPDPD